MTSQILIRCIESSEEIVASRPQEAVVANWREIVDAALARRDSRLCSVPGWCFEAAISHSRLRVDAWKGKAEGCPHCRGFVTPALVGRELPRVTMCVVGMEFAFDQDAAEATLSEAADLMSLIAWGWLG